jgi:hypothetical protein
MEQWEHDAFLGYMAECAEEEELRQAAGSVIDEIAARIGTEPREETIAAVADMFCIGPYDAAELYDAIAGNCF